MKAKQVRAAMKPSVWWAVVSNVNGYVCYVLPFHATAMAKRRAANAEKDWRIQKVRVVPVTAEDR